MLKPLACLFVIVSTALADGLPIGSSVAKPQPQKIVVSADYSGQDKLKNTSATINFSGVKATPAKTPSVQFGGKSVFLAGDPKNKPLEIEVGYGAVGGKPELSVSVYVSISPTGKPSRTRVTRPTFVKTYLAKAKADSLNADVFLTNWHSSMEADLVALEKAMNREFRTPGVVLVDWQERLDAAKLTVRHRYKRLVAEAEKSGKNARDRMEWIKATDKLLEEIESKGTLTYRIVAKDGNKDVVIGQSK